MSKPTPNSRDLRVPGYVLRRTNYGETDRILSLITPEGKFSALARGARKEKSKLAGSIELFTRSDFNLHFGHGDLAILTSARMQAPHLRLISDLALMELGADILRHISRAAEDFRTPEHFEIVDQTLMALQNGTNPELVRAWFVVNLKKSVGEELNFYRDLSGEKLSPEQTYRWDGYGQAFVSDPRGEFTASHIKFLRLLSGADLATVSRVRLDSRLLAPILHLTGNVL